MVFNAAFAVSTPTWTKKEDIESQVFRKAVGVPRGFLRGEPMRAMTLTLRNTDWSSVVAQVRSVLKEKDNQQVRVIAPAGSGKSTGFPGYLYKIFDRKVVVVVTPSDMATLSSYHGARFKVRDVPAAAVLSDGQVVGVGGGIIYMTVSRFVTLAVDADRFSSRVGVIICDEAHHNSGEYDAVRTLLARVSVVPVIYATATDRELDTAASVNEKIIKHIVENLSDEADVLEFLQNSLMDEIRRAKAHHKILVVLPDASSANGIADFFKDCDYTVARVYNGMPSSSAIAAHDMTTNASLQRYAIIADDSLTSSINIDFDMVVDTTVRRQVCYDEASKYLSFQSVPVATYEHLQRKWRLGRFNRPGTYYGPAIEGMRVNDFSRPREYTIDDVVSHQTILRAFSLASDDVPWSDYVADVSVSVARICVRKGFYGLIPLYILAKRGIDDYVASQLRQAGTDLGEQRIDQVVGPDISKFSDFTIVAEGLMDWVNFEMGAASVRSSASSVSSTFSGTLEEVSEDAVDITANSDNSSASSVSYAKNHSIVTECVGVKNKHYAEYDINGSTVLKPLEKHVQYWFSIEHNGHTYYRIGDRFCRKTVDGRYEGGGVLGTVARRYETVMSSLGIPMQPIHLFPDRLCATAYTNQDHVDYTSSPDVKDYATIESLHSTGSAVGVTADTPAGLLTALGALLRVRNYVIKQLYSNLSQSPYNDMLFRRAQDNCVMMDKLRSVYNEFFGHDDRFKIGYKSVYNTYSPGKNFTV